MAGSEFGQAVRRWRDQLSPEAAGLPAGGQRRAAGLRREELAMLAGISVDYVTRLEQGRAANPSAQVVEALARRCGWRQPNGHTCSGWPGWCRRGRKRCPRTSPPACSGCWTG
jgi:hypothetical protein